jgi:signal transduction histidine kinase
MESWDAFEDAWKEQINMIGAPRTPLSGDEFDHVSAAIAQGVPLEVALDLIMQRTCDLLEVHQAAFFLTEGPGPVLRLTAASMGLPAQPVLLAPNEGVEGWVARRARPLAVANPSADPRFAPFRSWSDNLPPDAVLAVAAVPVRTGAAVVGVLSVIDVTEPGQIEPATHPLGAASIAELLPFLAVLADLVALAIENSDILRRQERRTQFIKLLYTIATIPDSESTEALAHTITDQLCAITQAEVASILLHSATTDELIGLGISDTPLGRLQRESGHDHIPLATSGPLLQVFQSGIPVLICDAHGLDLLPALESASIQSLLIMPLRVEHESQGVVVLASTRADAFSDDDLSFITFISVRLGYALRHKTLADELAAAEQERIQQDARESFIAIVAHDLKNALMAISGSGHLALRKAARGDTQYSQKALPVVVAKAAQAIQLVNDMVDVNNVDRGRFRMFIAPVDLVILVREEVEAALGLSTQHMIELHTTFETLEIAADGQRLRQVLDNLISNAIRYSPAGGKIDVHLLAAPEHAAPSDAVTERGLLQAVMLTVADQGIGIAPGDLPHIFDRFYRGRGEHVASGSGLGLYIASEIIAQHGGRIWAESKPDAGTYFHVTLPKSRTEALQ